MNLWGNALQSCTCHLCHVGYETPLIWGHFESIRGHHGRSAYGHLITQPWLGRWLFHTIYMHLRLQMTN